MTGTRVYERVMVPAAIGDFEIPPISLVYFDPVAAEYRTISTTSLPAKVVPDVEKSPSVRRIKAAPTQSPG